MSKLKVVITDFGAPDSEIEYAELTASGLDVELLKLSTRTPEEVIQAAADADGLLVGFAPITRKVIESLTRCRVISRYGIGFNNVDIEAATEAGIFVCNVPDYCIEEVSTHTIAFLLCLNRHLSYQDRQMRAGLWVTPEERPPQRLAGQVLGVVGLGNIGQAVVAKALALGLRILGYDPYLAPEKAHQQNIELVTLDTLLRDADYVSLHCPFTDETFQLIGQAELALMKPSAYLINMARGEVVDQAALVDALTRGTIAGAALDVFEEEPLPADDPLLALDNVVLTGHKASWSDQAALQLRQDATRNVAAVLLGEVPKWVVNRDALGLAQ